MYVHAYVCVCMCTCRLRDMCACEICAAGEGVHTMLPQSVVTPRVSYAMVCVAGQCSEHG